MVSVIGEKCGSYYHSYTQGESIVRERERVSAYSLLGSNSD